MQSRLVLLLLVIALSTGRAAFAGDIPPAYRQVAAANGIPSELFYAVALAESGRDLDNQRPPIPWPWTLNIHGEGAYFSDRQSAWQAIIAAIATQRTSVDIGLMQVNWRYHRHRLKNPWRALDPCVNLQVAAEILKRCQQRLSDWWASVGCYHSPANAERAKRYRQRVHARWQILVTS